MIERKKRNALIALFSLFCALFLPWQQQAEASSDIGYVLTRGGTTITVRFSMRTCANGTKTEERWGEISYRELEDTDKAFFELSQWLYLNRKVLDDKNIGLQIDADPSCDKRTPNSFSISRVTNRHGELKPFRENITYKTGAFARTVIRELYPYFGITPAAPESPVPPLIAIETAREEKPCSYDRLPAADIRTTAFPGGPMWGKDERYGFILLYWNDNEAARKVSLCAGERRSEIPFTAEDFLRVLGTRN